MFRIHFLSIFILGAALALILSACGPGQFLGPTITPTHVPTATSTSTATPTATSTPTNTPRPTLTPTPRPTATATVWIGTPVHSGKWELTLLDLQVRDKIYSGSWYYQAKEGYVFIDVVFKVRNLDTSAPALTSSRTTVVIDEKGTAWAPSFWGARAATKAIESDPFALTVHFFPDESNITIDGETYMRFIYGLKTESRGKTIRFHFSDVPPVFFRIPK